MSSLCCIWLGSILLQHHECQNCKVALHKRIVQDILRKSYWYYFKMFVNNSIRHDYCSFYAWIESFPCRHSGWYIQWTDIKKYILGSEEFRMRATAARLPQITAMSTTIKRQVFIFIGKRITFSSKRHWISLVMFCAFIGFWERKFRKFQNRKELIW